MKFYDIHGNATMFDPSGESPLIEVSKSDNGIVIGITGENGTSRVEVTAEDIGARPNDWLPSLTDIGAAPAGYGLGVASPSWCPNRDCDQAVLSGWYRVSSSNDANNPGQSGVMFVSRYSDACIYQTFYGYSSTAPIKMRSNLGTGFGEWEWVNPPMALGVEYRTTERWNVKAVYTKLVSVGALPNNASKSVATGATASGIFQTHLIVYAAEGNVLESPYFTSDGTLKIKHNVSNNGTVTIYTTDDYSGATGYCQIWYTKD